MTFAARGFTGKERDAETGLDYFGARYYSGAQGRWTSPDKPLADQRPEDPQSWNLYGYVRNNPFRYIDPTGRNCVWNEGAGRWDDDNNGGQSCSYVEQNPVGDQDTVKGRDSVDFKSHEYSESDTQAFLDVVWDQATAGPVQGLINIYQNSRGGGYYDFSYSQLSSSTWTRCGRKMDAAQFGNYVAGFQGSAYDQSYLPSPFINFGAPVVEGAGVLFHLAGATKAKNDPLDRTGMPDIKAGEFGAYAFVKRSASRSCSFGY